MTMPKKKIPDSDEEDDTPIESEPDKDTIDPAQEIEIKKDGVIEVETEQTAQKEILSILKKLHSKVKNRQIKSKLESLMSNIAENKDTKALTGRRRNQLFRDIKKKDLEDFYIQQLDIHKRLMEYFTLAQTYDVMWWRESLRYQHALVEILKIVVGDDTLNIEFIDEDIEHPDIKSIEEEYEARPIYRKDQLRLFDNLLVDFLKEYTNYIKTGSFQSKIEAENLRNAMRIHVRQSTISESIEMQRRYKEKIHEDLYPPPEVL